MSKYINIFVLLTTPSIILLLNSSQDLEIEGVIDQRINRGMVSHALNYFWESRIHKKELLEEE
jgi:hypothetical protein